VIDILVRSWVVIYLKTEVHRESYQKQSNLAGVITLIIAFLAGYPYPASLFRHPLLVFKQ
jgi:hypothetical protein